MRAEQMKAVTVPLLTPLDEHGTIDFGGFDRLTERCHEAGVSGYLILGTAGEGYSLTMDTRLELIAYAERTLAKLGGMRLYGVLEHSTVQAAEFIRRARQAGACEFAVVPPFYDEVRPDDVLRHYEHIVEATDGRIWIYNLPALTGVDIQIQTVEKLARLPRVAGIKNSSGDMYSFLQLIARVQSPDIRVFQGSEELAVPSLLLGADGIIPCGANLFPRFFVFLARRNLAEIGKDRMQKILDVARQILDLQSSAPYWIASLKAACQVLGICGTGVCPPYAAVTAGALAEAGRKVAALEVAIEEAQEWIQ